MSSKKRTALAEAGASGRRNRRNRAYAVLVLSPTMVIALCAQTPATNGFGGTSPDGTQTLAGHAPVAVRNQTAVFRYHASVNIDGRIVLPLRHHAKLAEPV